MVSMFDFSARPLAGKKGVILGIANEHSIAYGCAQAFRGLGADVALTYANDKARPFVEPLAKVLEAPIFLPCDVRVLGQLENVFQVAEQTWGKLDFALHSIALAPKQDLHSPLSQCSRDGFLQAMEVSCYSFIRMAHLAAPLMRDGGTILTMTYYGAEKVIENYNVMGPVKAALESSVRYLANEFGPKRIRVHAISPGPIKTRAASGIEHFDELLERAAQRAPARDLVSIEDVGSTTAFLATDYARLMTGETIYVDGGYHIVG
jgi:enoyl-[acyl-carrier protein] reductase I